MDTYTTNFHESSHNSYDIVKYLKLYFNISNYDDDHLFTTDEIFDILCHKIDNAPLENFLLNIFAKGSEAAYRLKILMLKEHFLSAHSRRRN